MQKLIRTPAQQRWAQELLAQGVHAFASSLGLPVAARRWLATLEAAAAIRQWQIVDEDLVFDLEDPDTGLPLYVAAEHWDDFEAEAKALGLTEAS